MKIRSLILLLILGLILGAGVNPVWACGSGGCNMKQKQITQQTCHKHASCCEKTDRHSKQNPDKKNCGNCPCSGCGPSFSFSNALAAEFSAELTCFPAESADKQAFYFAGHIPQTVHLPIWHPPRI